MYRTILLALLVIISLGLPSDAQRKRANRKQPPKKTSVEQEQKPKVEKVSPSVQAARAAIKALRTLDVATEIGTTRRDYSERLIEVKIKVTENLTEIPEGELKKLISDALAEYVGAMRVWDEIARDRGRFSVLENTLVANYKKLMSIQWERARDYLNEATSLIAKTQKTAP